ncbi:MAG: hypothetical protein GC154_17845 [bacterium]|nr:hypothetical protein [bacterium]
MKTFSAISLFTVLLFTVFIPAHAARMGENAILMEEMIFENAPFPSCHASSIVEVEPRVYLAAWFGGKGEGDPSVGIWMARRDENGWSGVREVASHSGVPCWNPVLFQTPDGETLLFYKAGPNPREWSGLLKRSHDGGMTWSDDELLPAGVLGPIRAKPILLHDGTLLCPSSVESWQTWACWMEMTKDFGKTWEKHGPIFVPDQLNGIIQPTVFVADDGSLKMFCRSRGIGHICASSSTDGGKTWAPAHPIELPNPSAGIDCVKMSDGRAVMIYNHTTRGRHNLSLAVSSDDGNTWKQCVVLEDQPGEYSYPAMIQGSDGKLHATYTYRRERIKHVVVDPRSIQ